VSAIVDEGRMLMLCPWAKTKAEEREREF